MSRLVVRNPVVAPVFRDPKLKSACLALEWWRAAVLTVWQVVLFW